MTKSMTKVLNAAKKLTDRLKRAPLQCEIAKTARMNTQTVTRQAIPRSLSMP